MDRRPVQRRWLDATALAAIAALLLLFWRVRIMPRAPGITFAGSDVFTYFVPMYAAIGDAFRAGRFPFWNPYQSCGEPLLGVLQGGALYPARLLLLFLSPSQALGWSTLLHLTIAAVGMFALPRALGIGIAGSIAASIAFTYGFGAPAIYAPAAFLEPGVWCPIACWAMLRVLETRRAPYLALTAFAIGAPILAGGYQVALYSFYGTALFAVGLLLDRRTRPLLSWRAIAIVAAVAAFAIAVSSPQWLPTVLWAREAVRSTQALSAAQIDPWGASPSAVAAALVARRRTIDAFFIGMPIATLAIVGILFGRRSVLPLAIGGCVAFLLSLGPKTPWFGLYYLLPGFSMFRLPGRLHYLVLFAAAMSAAAGVDVLRRWAKPSGRLRMAMAGLAVAVGVIVTYRSLPREPLAQGRMPVEAMDLVPVATVLATAALPPALVGPAALVPVVVGLLGRRVNDSVLPYNGGESEFTRHHATLRHVAEQAGLSRVTFAANQPLFDVSFTTKQATLAHFYSPADYEPLASRRLSHYLELLVGGHVVSEGSTIPAVGDLQLAAPLAHPRLLDMLSVRYLVAPREGVEDANAKAFLSAYAPVPELVAASDRQSLRVYVNPRALPRAYTVEGVRPAPDDAEAELAITAASFDPTRDTVLTGDVDARPGGDALKPCDITGYDAERVVVRTDAARDAILVLTDAYAPGWVATVDGATTPIWPANVIFRGVAVPAGAHEVVFTYSAPGFAVAVLIAAAAIVGALMALVVARSMAGVATPQ